MYPAKLPGLLLITLALLGCSPEQQDQAQAQQQLVAISTSAAGHRIAGAVVFIDRDRDGMRDPLEAFALSNEQGQTQSDPALCQPDSEGRRASDCLVIPAGEPSAMLLRARGGYDIEAAVPFVGELAAEVGPGALQMPDTARPLLNTVQALRAAAETDGLELPLAEDLLLQAFVGAFVAKVSAETSDAAGLSDLGGAVLREVGLALQQPGAQGEPLMLEQFVSEVGSVRGLTRRVLERHAPDLAGQSEDIAAIVQSVAGAVSAMNAIQPGGSLGVVRAARLMVLKAGRRGGNRSQVESDAAYFTLPQGSDTPAELLNQLGVGEFDLEGLRLVSFSGDGARLAELARIPATTQQFDQVAGGLVEAGRRDADTDARVLAFFGGSAGATNGPLQLCIRFLSTTSEFRSETQGALLRGEWRKVGGRRVLLVLDELGLTDSALLSVIAPVEGDGAVQRYRLHYGGLATELSGGVVQSSAEQPATNDECLGLLGGA